MASVLGGVEGYFEVVGTPWDAESSPGLEGWIEVVRDDEREALALPSGSIVRAALGDYVYRQTGPTTALRRRVTLGARRDELIEVVEGLSEGDHVVSVGAKDLWILELAMVGGVGQLPEFQSEVQR